MNHRDIALLFTARCIRMFGYGLLAVVVVLYLDAVGLSGAQIGLLLTLTLLGDAAISLWLTTHADRLGRRRVLLVGAVLLLAGGLAFAATPVFAVLLVAATIGVISPSGNEVGPFLAVEQASLTQLVDPVAPDPPVHPLPAGRLPVDGVRRPGRGRGGPARRGPCGGTGRRLPRRDRRLCARRRRPGGGVLALSHRPSRFPLPRSWTRRSARASGSTGRRAW